LVVVEVIVAGTVEVTVVVALSVAMTSTVAPLDRVE
jgi:hypothetical protein